MSKECKYPFVEGLGSKSNIEGYLNFLRSEVKRVESEEKDPLIRKGTDYRFNE